MQNELLNLCTSHPDTIFMWAIMWGSLVVFRNQNGFARKKKKKSVKQCTAVSTAHLHTPPQCTTVWILRHWLTDIPV